MLLPVTDTILRNDAALDAIVSPNAPIEKIAGGFGFTEGPLWFREGYLLFSDIPANKIYRWSGEDGVTEFRHPSGYDGNDAPAGAFIGSNGLTRDRDGRLVICEHGNGRVTRLDHTRKLTVLAHAFEGKRLNSPNDLIYKSDGALYFTDPPYGLPLQDDDPKKELSFNGVYRLFQEKLELLLDNLTRPNGLAFSPDEKVLYLANSDRANKHWMRYEVTESGELTNGKVFFDVNSETADGVPDGLKVDSAGNIFATGPGGIWIFSPAGKHLGSIFLPEIPANLNWGNDGKSLFITARTSVYRIRVNIGGSIQ